MKVHERSDFAGETIEATVTFSEAVSVSGSPRLPLRIGSDTRYVAYQSGESTSTVLVFAYTVVVADTDLDGITVDKFALELNAGAITETGVDAALTHTGELAPEGFEAAEWQRFDTLCEELERVLALPRADALLRIEDLQDETDRISEGIRADIEPREREKVE